MGYTIKNIKSPRLKVAPAPQPRGFFTRTMCREEWEAASQYEREMEVQKQLCEMKQTTGISINDL